MNRHDQQTIDNETLETLPGAHFATADDAPHECEFCSPEPEIIPAPWESESAGGAARVAGSLGERASALVTAEEPAV